MPYRTVTLGSALAMTLLAGTWSAPASAAPAGAKVTVTSSLRGKTSLPLRSKWTATVNLPAEDVQSVNFFIDGRMAWSEKNAPYVFGADDGFLITTFLAPGRHTFTTTVLTKESRVASDTVELNVASAPPPPTALNGVWTRSRTDANPILTGRWRLTFDRVGAWVLDPVGTGVVEQSNIAGNVLTLLGPVRMSPEEEGVFAHGAHVWGHICEEGSPAGTFRWTVSGDRLTLTAVDAGCSNRQDLLQGTWIRVR
ncbi:hypothetical protein [Deinococcus pimensis]|uniref:hypothetical protein n=1 Tax=Deinococcus pimensis TaxID=309888 RepID=UPI000486E333|nr:hypothetical protein [Deinococcus pimensis]